MDPQVCYERILKASDSRNAEELNEAMGDLFNWLVKDGFPPRVALTYINNGRFAIQYDGNIGIEFVKLSQPDNIALKRFNLPFKWQIATTREHYEKYAQLAKECGVKFNDPDIANPLFGCRTIESLRMKLLQDPHLNNIPLHLFDLWTKIYNSFNQKKLTLSDGCCMCKHLLKYQLLKIEPYFV